MFHAYGFWCSPSYKTFNKALYLISASSGLLVKEVTSVFVMEIVVCHCETTIIANENLYDMTQAQAEMFTEETFYLYYV